MINCTRSFGQVKGCRSPGRPGLSYNDVASSDCHECRITRPYKDARNTLLWQDKTCPAHSQLIMTWKALLLLLLLSKQTCWFCTKRMFCTMRVVAWTSPARHCPFKWFDSFSCLSGPGTCRGPGDASKLLRQQPPLGARVPMLGDTVYKLNMPCLWSFALQMLKTLSWLKPSVEMPAWQVGWLAGCWTCSFHYWVKHYVERHHFAPHRAQAQVQPEKSTLRTHSLHARILAST